MAHEEAIGHGLAALAQFFVGDATVRETLDRVAELAVASLPGADLAGITMVVDGKPATAVFTDRQSPDIDSAQYRTGEGPCVDAWAGRHVNRIDSMTTDGRWPAFAAACLDHGVLSTLSVPLVVKHESLGALNFYAHRESAFGPSDEEAGRAFATQAAIVLANTQAYWDARGLAENLTQAMATRAVIEQAKGILMAAGGRTPDQAFALLVHASQRDNRKLRDIAAEIVADAAAGSP